MPNPSRSGRPTDSHGCMITTTPTKPITTAASLRGDSRSLGRNTSAKKTAASGVVALPMPASAEETRTSPAAKRLNGRAVRNTPETARCPQTRRSRGSRPPVTASRASRVAVPAKILSPEIWSGAMVRSPTFMSRKLEPQMRASRRYFACQGTRVVAATGTAGAPVEPGSVGLAATLALMGGSTLGSFGPFRGHVDRCALNAPGPLGCESGETAGGAGGDGPEVPRCHAGVGPAAHDQVGGTADGARAVGGQAPGIQGHAVL